MDGTCCLTVERLAAFLFEAVLPGHGQRVHLPAFEMRQHMTNLVNIEQNGENIYYYNTFIQGFNGLYKQAQLLLDYAANKTKEKMDAFIVQRNINFAGIKKLEGELFTKK